ncbi:CCA tRNA nucleotidyltransferase [Sulfobacillus harzensis]|uniref:CCA tRNA nucleotidyltransferase n=1 Tax=Sulfobacillus harzensis TaxID=2729629 RepID=A0A7Y0Q3A1_9FIRM|nr:CCA tRNA nucleotidyltransferase [Sulfobacillus harzensis]NMP21979.1 CCA tRNA nucleotidyltransferase [Sulfobacillus harzensis]
MPFWAVEQQIFEMPMAGVVRDAIARIRAQGGQAWIVGGAIRDWVWNPRGFNPDHVEWDLATDLAVSTLAQLKMQTHPGEAFGTFWLAPRVEVTHLRRDRDYTDRRRPQSVESIDSLVEDLTRRDLTVNAVAYDGHRVTAVDGALDDLATHTLRAVGDANARFQEDPLRILRLWRFAAVTGAGIHPSTEEAARALVDLTQGLSRERRLAEFLRFLKSPVERWPLWSEAGLDVALEWPTMPQEMVRVPLRVPDHPVARIAVYSVCRGLGLQHLTQWADRWPLPREWRRALMLAGRTAPDLQSWVEAARNPRGRERWIFRHLAWAFGAPSLDIEPLELAIGAHDLKERWSLTGTQVGKLLEGLAVHVAKNPKDNNPETLWALAETWASSREIPESEV